MFSSISFFLLPGSLQFACALTYCDSMAKLKNRLKGLEIGEKRLFQAFSAGKPRASRVSWVKI